MTMGAKSAAVKGVGFIISSRPFDLERTGRGEPRCALGRPESARGQDANASHSLRFGASPRRGEPCRGSGRAKPLSSLPNSARPRAEAHRRRHFAAPRSRAGMRKGRRQLAPGARRRESRWIRIRGTPGNEADGARSRRRFPHEMPPASRSSAQPPHTDREMRAVAKSGAEHPLQVLSGRRGV